MVKNEYHKYPEVTLAKYKEKENLKSSIFLLFFRLIAGVMDRNINITIAVYVPAQRFKGMFSFEIA